MKFFKELPKKIQIMAIISRVALFISVAWAGYLMTHRCRGWWLFYFDYNLNYIILLFLVLIGLLLELISWGLRKKIEVSLPEPKIWLISFWGSLFLLAVIFTLSMIGGPGPCSWSRDAKIISGMNQMRAAMTIIYEQDGNYDRVNCTHKLMKEPCELVDMFYRESEENISMFSIRRYKKAYDRDGKEPVIVRDSSVNSQAICIYSPLNICYLHGAERCWYCVDSTGLAGVTTKINPASPGYCVKGQSAVCPHSGD